MNLKYTNKNYPIGTKFNNWIKISNKIKKANDYKWLVNRINEIIETQKF